MIEFLTVENVALSLLANGIGLVIAMRMKSAPPRLVLYVCLASMFAIFVPWSSIGVALGSYLPVVAVTGVGVDGPILREVSEADGLSLSQLARYIVLLWFGIGLSWICLLYTSPSPRDATLSRMPSSA